MSTVEEKRPAVGADSDYDSEEDADFHDSDAFSERSSDDEDAPRPRTGEHKDLDSGDETTISKTRKRRRGTGDATGEDLILTRAQKRTKDDAASAKSKAAPAPQDKPEDLDALWTKINVKTSVEEPQKTETAHEKGSVIIKRTYEFAGQTVTEEKAVPKESAEAKAYLSSVHTSSSPGALSQATKPLARRPVKRKSNLEEMAKGNKPAKLNVLEKSRLDWAGFVDKEGIQDDLKRYNKDGYIERQEFLKRSR